MKPRHKRKPPPQGPSIARGALHGNPRLRGQRRHFAIGIVLFLAMTLVVGLAAIFGPTSRDARVAVAVVALLLGGSGWLLAFYAGAFRLLDVQRRKHRRR